MPWHALSGSKILYNFTQTETSYTLLVTDLISVWKEELDQANIRSRGQRLHSIVELKTPDQIANFNIKLETLLATGNFDSDAALLNVSQHIPQIGTISWEFKLHILSPKEAAIELQTLILDLYKVIGSIHIQLQNSNEDIRQKNYHIRSMVDAIARSSDYNPRRYVENYENSFLKDSTGDLQDENGAIAQFSQLVELAVEFWPQDENQKVSQQNTDPSVLADSTIPENSNTTDSQDNQDVALSPPKTETAQERRRKLEERLQNSPKKRRRR